jgi:hypothetical protein
VFSGEWEVGRIYETRGGPDNLRWFWSLTVNDPMTRSDRVATVEKGKAQFQKSWDAWKAWANLEERVRGGARSGGAHAWGIAIVAILLERVLIIGAIRNRSSQCVHNPSFPGTSGRGAARTPRPLASPALRLSRWI